MDGGFSQINVEKAADGVNGVDGVLALLLSTCDQLS